MIRLIMAFVSSSGYNRSHPLDSRVSESGCELYPRLKHMSKERRPHRRRRPAARGGIAWDFPVAELITEMGDSGTFVLLLVPLLVLLLVPLLVLLLVPLLVLVLVLVLVLLLLLVLLLTVLDWSQAPRTTTMTRRTTIPATGEVRVRGSQIPPIVVIDSPWPRALTPCRRAGYPRANPGRRRTEWARS